MGEDDEDRRNSPDSMESRQQSVHEPRDRSGSALPSVVSNGEDQPSGSRRSGIKQEEDGEASVRKRRRRSHSSPELHSPANYPPEYPFPAVDSPSSFARDLSGTHLAGNSESSGSSTAPPTALGGRMQGEDTITLRRREANRLAAQRFRSRKKGYQDSLEERIKQLEDERDGLLRRLGEFPEGIQRGEDDPYTRYPSYAPPDRRQFGGIAGPSVSPERREMIDVDVRVASLESANRRLQDELRAAVEENEKLVEELDQWRRSARDQPGPSNQRHEEKPTTSRRPSLPPLDSSQYATNNYPGPQYLPPLAGPSSHPSHPPLERARTYHNGPPPRVNSPGFRLPPLRLPPLPANISDSRTLPSPSMMSFPSGDPFRPSPGISSPRLPHVSAQTSEEARRRQE